MTRIGSSVTPARPGLPWKMALAWTLFSIYAPMVMGFTADCGHCRALWLKIWPVVTGGVIVEIGRAALHMSNDGEIWRLALSGLLSLGWIALVFSVGRRGWRWMIGAGLVALAYSSCAVWGALSALRA